MLCCHQSLTRNRGSCNKNPKKCGWDFFKYFLKVLMWIESVPKNFTFIKRRTEYTQQGCRYQILQKNIVTCCAYLKMYASGILERSSACFYFGDCRYDGVNQWIQKLEKRLRCRLCHKIASKTRIINAMLRFM